ncbi:D-alanine aminotransferase [Paenibacillus konkukensis]|uniref:D-alanine aminotransferase n=1 Tax=Paenibacillus konkukensis TaxID=2020716 RepID=A0ABY4RLH4_9BACL|nr:D-amino-acid transaminase [Paenibacillus konkukensis]UQZ82736.1 D-alanine aminotransferase [Paenibacillus konkukensis]
MYLYQHEFLPKDELRISSDDRGYYFGDGIYEVFRVYNGMLFEPAGHYERLERSARDVRISLPYSIDRLDGLLRQLIELNKLSEGIVYMQITRGAAERTHAFPKQAEPILTAYCSELARPLQALEHGIAAVTADDIRWLRCDLKTLNLLPNVMAKQAALDQGAQDVIFHRSGTVTECSSSNIMIVKDGELRTHPANHLILHGITRAVVLRLAAELHIPAKEEAFTLDDLNNADEVFLSSTTMEITPIVSIDRKPVGSGAPGPVTRKLQSAFEHLIGSGNDGGPQA